MDWHARLRGGVHADFIMDRIVHTAVWLESGEANMRAKLSRLEDQATPVSTITVATGNHSQLCR